MRKFTCIATLLTAITIQFSNLYGQEARTVLRELPNTNNIVATKKTAAKYTVVVDLDRNMLHFKKDTEVLWSAPVGTGTGLRLKGKDQEWDFATPTGSFNVQYKELNPVWYAPDWYFVENNKPIPSMDSPERRFQGTLGAAAIYIGNDLAIHGTDKPELLGQQVSHGCIRLSDANALRLFHNVQVGTEIIIIGNPKRTTAPVPAATRPATRPATSRTPASAAPIQQQNFLERLTTDELLERLEEELWLSVYSPQLSKWTEIANVLSERGIKDDSKALRGMLSLAGRYQGKTDAEVATYLADVFSRSPMRTIVALSRIPEVRQRAAAEAIVHATVGLHGVTGSVYVLPWPTKKLSQSLLGPEGRIGLELLRIAEQEFQKNYVYETVVAAPKI